MNFDPQKYGVAVANVLVDEPVCALGPGRPNAHKKPDLDVLNEDAIFAPHSVADRDMARCCVSGLWLLYNFLENSHVISQEIHSATGSYWHGIMHRREPDYSNAKYWFRKVGNHPIFEPLGQSARDLAASESLDGRSEFLAQQNAWDPFQFIDLCESVARGRSSAESLCKRIAQIEWRLLFDYCYERAIGA